MKVQVENINAIANFDNLPIGQVFIWEDDENVYHFYMKIACVEVDRSLYNAIDLETGDLDTFSYSTVIIPKNYSFKIEM